MHNITEHILYDKLLSEFHPTMNENLRLSDFSAGSEKKVWWKCNVADDHEWTAVINDRTRGGNCSCCSGRTVVPSNCLSTTHPELAKQWHPTKNGDLTPNDVTAGSNKKVWWKCDLVDDHEWTAVINNRANGKGCSCCSGRTVAPSNCLATTHPELAKQWHPTKNGDLTPNDVMIGLNKKVWWKCDVADDHEWEAVVNSRANGKGCSCCSGRTIVPSNCLAATHPELAKQWHPTRNGSLTPGDTISGSNKKVWWKCDAADDHEWEASPNRRASGHGCPCCTGRRVVKSNCLATTHPELSKQWHSTRNGSLTPSDITAGGGTKIWWKCSINDNHEWITAISNRTSGTGCPYCNESKGEKLIAKILKEKGIYFTRQKRFKDCKNKTFLPFDFYLPSLNVLIEYDGIFHYEPIEFVGGTKKLKETQMRDKIKTKYALDNNINLLRIPYTEFNNVEHVIKNFLITLNNPPC